MAIDKKYVKLGVAGLAVVALVVGLSVGLTQKNQNKSGSMEAANAVNGGNVAADFDKESLKICSPSSRSSKGGKSGGGKSGKSGGSGSGDSSDDGSGRRLVVPGTEDYERVDIDIDPSKRRKLRNELMRGESMSIEY